MRLQGRRGIKKMKCTTFINDDYEDRPVHETLCRCPKCKGFLPRNFPLGKQFRCKKCGIILETIPSNPYADEDDIEDDSDDYEYGGKICIVPDYTIKGEK